jgi:hypothetical protein
MPYYYTHCCVQGGMFTGWLGSGIGVMLTAVPGNNTTNINHNISYEHMRIYEELDGRAVNKFLDTHTKTTQRCLTSAIARKRSDRWAIELLSCVIPLPFFHGCRKRRRKDYSIHTWDGRDQTAMGLPPVTFAALVETVIFVKRRNIWDVSAYYQCNIVNNSIKSNHALPPKE